MITKLSTCLVVAIRSFLSFLYQDGYIHTNIAKLIVLPFTESTMPHVLTQTECDKIRNACANSPRDMAIIELLLQTGMKLSELTALTINDVEIQRSNITGDQDSVFIRLIGGREKRKG
jgi:site-specific recombinase XerD